MWARNGSPTNVWQFKQFFEILFSSNAARNHSPASFAWGSWQATQPLEEVKFAWPSVNGPADEITLCPDPSLPRVNIRAITDITIANALIAIKPLRLLILLRGRHGG